MSEPTTTALSRGHFGTAPIEERRTVLQSRIVEQRVGDNQTFLPRGDAKSLRTGEISNWTGKATAAPRTELDELLQRPRRARI